MQLLYAIDGAERELRGDDSYRTEVWDCDPEPVAEVESVGDALRAADDHGRGVYYLFEGRRVLGAICSIHAARFEDRVWFYPAPGAACDTWCVCGQEPDGPWEPLETGLPSEEAARDWLRANHGDHPECDGFYIDRESNEGSAESYFDRVPDGLVEHVGCNRREFA
jgi:hypothetical protein